MLDSRRTGTGHVEVIPRSMLAVRRSIAGVRRLLLVAIIAFIAMPIAMLLTHAGPVLPFLPIAISVAGAAWFTIEIRRLERDLRRARVRALDAVDAERQRIHRDLHDGAQQRLVSIRIHLGLLAQTASSADEVEAIERVGRDLDAALADIRSATRDSSPQLLVRSGVVESLRAVADHTPRAVTIESVGFGRYEPQLERAIYFSCLEALQNAVKHAGPRAAVWIRLVGDAHQVSFSVDDSGVGFDPSRVEAGAGLVNLADRVEVLGGHLTIDSLPGMGTRIRGVIPVEATQVLSSFSSTPARSGVRARLGAGVDVGACAEIYRSQGGTGSGAPGDQGAESRPLSPARPS